MKRYKVVEWENGYNVADTYYSDSLEYDSELTKEEAEEFAEELNEEEAIH